MTAATRATAFLALTFAMSWSALILAWSLGNHALGDVPLAGIVNVFSPGLAALIAVILFEKGQRREALGLHFRPNWWWLWAVLIPLGLFLLMPVVAAPFSPYEFVGFEGMAQRIADLAGQFDPGRRQAGANPAISPLPAAGATVLLLIGFAIFFTLSEELGWRGYLYHLWRRFGFWRYSLVTGAIWGVWHWPLIYLFGHAYPDHRVFGLLLFPIFCMLLSVPMTLVRDRGGSTWAAGILHGIFNATALAMPIAFDMPQFPWTMTGIAGICALALGVLAVAPLQRSGHEG